MGTVSTFVGQLARFDSAMSGETRENLEVLLRGAVLSSGPRTVSGCLVSAWPWFKKHFTTYENVLRRAKMDLGAMARQMFQMILPLLPADGVIELVVDETLVRRYGPRVSGIGMHRDAVQSGRGYPVVTPGHKWVVVSVVVAVKGVKRALALPLACALYTPQKPAKRNRTARMYRRHRTVGKLTRLLVRMIVKWAPERRFRLIGDAAYATHELADALQPDSKIALLRSVTLVSRLRPDARLYAPPPKYAGMGRPRTKGEKLPTPQEVAENPATRWEHVEVAWYGQTRKTVRICSRTGLWYKCGNCVKKVRWVFVRDPDGKRPDEVLFTTDLSLSAVEIVETYVRRWSQETTFQETRRELGLETMRNRSGNAVKRSVPMLLSVYSLIVTWYAAHVDDPEKIKMETPWYTKSSVTFSDMLAAVRQDVLRERLLWPSSADPCGFFLPPGPWMAANHNTRRKKKPA